MNRALSLYRLMLWAYPPAFRQDFGEEMLFAFEDSLHAAVHRQQVAGFWWLMVRDLTVSSTREWLLTVRRQQPMSTTTFDSQILSTVRFMSRALRSGYSVHQIATLIANNAPEPTSTVFRDFAAKMQETGSSKDALAFLEGQLESKQYRDFVSVLQTQFAEGGNLADRFDEFAIHLDEGNDWSAGVDLSA